MSETPKWLLDEYGTYADELSEDDQERLWKNKLISDYGCQADEEEDSYE